MPFTKAQIKALSAKLSAKHVKTREHEGLTLSYIEGWQRRMLETIKTAEEAKTFWARNCTTVAGLRKDFPQLKTNKGAHYADILGAV